jgi:hypothetical protein
VAPPAGPLKPAAPAAPVIAPAPLRTEAKKETAKVTPPPSASKPLPQATVQLQRKPDQSASKSASTSAPITVVTEQTEVAGSGEINPILGIAALIMSLAALGVQLWIWVS